MFEISIHSPGALRVYAQPPTIQPLILSRGGPYPVERSISRLLDFGPAAERNYGCQQGGASNRRCHPSYYTDGGPVKPPPAPGGMRC